MKLIIDFQYNDTYTFALAYPGPLWFWMEQQRWGSQGVDERALPATMEVEYVRIFQK